MLFVHRIAFATPPRIPWGQSLLYALLSKFIQEMQPDASNEFHRPNHVGQDMRTVPVSTKIIMAHLSTNV